MKDLYIAILGATRVLAAVLAVLSTVGVSHAESITPSGREVRFVSVYEDSTAQSGVIGRIGSGEAAVLIADVPRWYKVSLADGTEGFVSKGWTVLVADENLAIAFTLLMSVRDSAFWSKAQISTC